MRFQKPPTGAVLNPLHPLSRGLVGYWLFNEGAGSLVNDISGHGNHGKLTNMLPNIQGSGWGSSKSGGTLQFDGIDDYVDCGSDASFDTGTQLTVEAWVKPREPFGSYARILDSGRWAGPNSWIFMRWAAEDQWQFSIVDSLGNFRQANTGADSLEHNIWQHVVGVYDGINLIMYKNGVPGSPVSIVNQAIIASGTVRISTSGNSFNGLIDEVRIYNRALSAAEVKMLYEQPYCNLMK